MKRLLAGMLLGLFVVVQATAAQAATYYIGAFAGSTPADTPSCGTRSNPCATLYYFMKNRKSSFQPGDTLRLAPGIYRNNTSDIANGGTTHNCILLDSTFKNSVIEGRTAADGVLDDHESVVIDGLNSSSDGYEGANPCSGSLVKPTSRSNLCQATTMTAAQDYSGVTIRDMKFQNSQALGSYGGATIVLCAPRAGAANGPNGVTLERIRVTGGLGGGIEISENDASYTDANCASRGRALKNISIIDSEIDHEKGGGGMAGIFIGCSDGVTIRRSSVHDQCNLADCSQCGVFVPLDDARCDDHDGINGGGGINVQITDTEVYNVGEDGIDVGGHPSGKSHDWLIERSSVYNSANANYKASGSQNVTIRNSFAWGRGDGFTTYGCARNVKLHNNTFWMQQRPVMSWNYLTNSEFKNNVFVRVGTANDTAVFIDQASTNSTNVWQNNIVHNTSGSAFGEYNGNEAYIPLCDGWNAGRTTYDESQDCSIGYNPPPIPCPAGVTASPWILASDEGALTIFRYSGAAGQWFGAGTGQGDRWGASPIFAQNPLVTPSVANLHLASLDVIARDAAQPLISFFATDYDNDPRPQGSAWDIGADESSRQFYVDLGAVPGAGCDDANSGTDRATPWCTIPGTRTASDSGFLRRSWGGITNFRKLAPGDTIWVKGGTTMTSARGGRLMLGDTGGQGFWGDGLPETPISIRNASSAATPGGAWGVGHVTYDCVGMTIPAYDGCFNIFRGANPRGNYVNIRGISDTARIVLKNASGTSVQGMSFGGIPADKLKGLFLEWFEEASASAFGVGIYDADGVTLWRCFWVRMRLGSPRH
jgi:hypothetical protein